MCEPYYEALPSALKPVHYDLSITDISDTDYQGTVKIHLEVQQPTDELHLHYRDLTVAHASAVYCNETVAASVSAENPKKEFFVLKFEKEFAAGDVAVTIAFAGKIQTNMAGFYKSSYTENGETKHMLSTQFEATDARRAFPCLDEPALKATFTVDIETDASMCVLGNMPVAAVREKGDGLKVVTFEKTPVMSTYLLAWAVGDFEYIESHTDDLYHDGKPLPVRIYTTPGYTKDARLASEIAPKIVDYFSKVFEVKYPLPKLDLIAVHAFSHNAMENWGLITYRSTALLYSEETSDPAYKQKVAYVVAHEIAHQWFGNLVTMEWWDELWLNEGFATWVGFYAVDYLFPEWDIFAGFVSTSLQEALRLDGLRNSHPIKVPVMDALDIDQLFDAISYLKGASTILMLSTYLTTDVFLKGVAKYLNENKFANATSGDLWSAISSVAGKDVSAMMESWITKIGFPVVNVSATEAGVQLSQARFLNGGGVKPEEDDTVWWVPLNLTSDTKIAVDSISAKKLQIDTVPNGLFKLNKDTDAPFRVNYEPEFLQKHVLGHFEALSAKDVVGVIADVFSMAVSGESQTSTTTFLEMVKLVTLDNDYLGTSHVVWLELCNRLSAFSTTFKGVDDNLTQRVSNFCTKVCERITLQLKSEEIAKEDFLKTKLRSDMLNFSSTLGVPELSSYGKEIFESWKSGKRIDPSLRYFMFSSIVSDESVTREDFDAIVKEVTHPDSLDSREVALHALGSIANAALVPTLLSYLADASVIPTMDAHFLAVPLSKNIKVRDQFWTFFRENYDVFHKNMSTNMVVLDRFIKMTLCNYQSTNIEREVREFFADKDIHGFERALHQVLDQICINAAWCERDQASVAKWLESNGF